jgi:uncharacterized protein
MKDDDFFWEGAKNGELLFQCCSECREIRHPPLPMCPNCQSLKWAPKQASGRGTIYSWILSKHPGIPDDPGRIVVLIDLDEGIRFVSNLHIDDMDAITEGMPVEVFYKEIDGNIFPQFKPAA